MTQTPIQFKTPSDREHALSPLSTSPPLIFVENVNMIFRSRGQETVALENASLEVQAGEFISLIGPSGCGKTTLLRLLADLEQPTGGTLTLLGMTPAQARAARTYGYVFQAPVLYDWRTVMGNVMLPLEVMNFPREQRTARVREMLKLVGLEKFEKSFPWQLSGGMQQRVSIARALAFDPKLLFMDEPFGALDEITRENLNMELLKLWRETQKTVLFVTHSIEEAVFLSTRVVVMCARPGRIVQVLEVDLGSERDEKTRESREFFEICTKVREALREGHV